MSVVINHVIVHCRNKEESAAFLAEILGLPAPSAFHRFQVVRMDNGATLDFLDSPDEEIVWEHFAFLVGEADFDVLKAHGFSEDDAWDIAGISAFFGMSNRLANVTSMRPNAEFYALGR